MISPICSLDCEMFYRRAAFIFRQPMLSMISNIFALPFQRSVWIAMAVFLLAVLGLLYVSSKWEYRCGTSAYWESLNPAEQTLSDNLMVVLGAMAQQGKGSCRREFMIETLNPLCSHVEQVTITSRTEFHPASSP